MKRFVDLADFTREEVMALLELARRLERQPEPRALIGKLLGLVFFNPSLRTLASFQAAMARLGGHSLVINPGQGSWQMETRAGVVMDGAAAEHVREGIPVLAAYCDALGIRVFAEGRDLAACDCSERSGQRRGLVPIDVDPQLAVRVGGPDSRDVAGPLGLG